MSMYVQQHTANLHITTTRQHRETVRHCDPVGEESGGESSDDDANHDDDNDDDDFDNDDNGDNANENNENNENAKPTTTFGGRLQGSNKRPCDQDSCPNREECSKGEPPRPTYKFDQSTRQFVQHRTLCKSHKLVGYRLCARCKHNHTVDLFPQESRGGVLQHLSKCMYDSSVSAWLRHAWLWMKDALQVLPPQRGCRGAAWCS